MVRGAAPEQHKLVLCDGREAHDVLASDVGHFHDAERVVPEPIDPPSPFPSPLKFSSISRRPPQGAPRDVRVWVLGITLVRLRVRFEARSDERRKRGKEGRVAPLDDGADGRMGYRGGVHDVGIDVKGLRWSFIRGRGLTRSLSQLPSIQSGIKSRYSRE
ncbi:hypothetical protein BC826DRAFT_1054738 [Russula brevipes]|nr:hypothetical protein BC826DRAFT_1054738 [Russula brevipes]